LPRLKLGVKSKTVVASFFALVVGCGRLPTVNNPTTPIISEGVALTEAQVSNLIQSAVPTTHWRIVSYRPGEITVELALRNDRATALIRYNATGYSISHLESSPGFQYNGARGVIHPRYNGWVTRLDKAIQKEINQYVLGVMMATTTVDPPEVVVPQGAQKPKPQEQVIVPQGARKQPEPQEQVIVPQGARKQPEHQEQVTTTTPPREAPPPKASEPFSPRR